MATRVAKIAAKPMSLQDLMPLRLPDDTPGLVGLQDLAAETIAKATALPLSAPRALLHDLQMMTALINTYASSRIEKKDEEKRGTERKAPQLSDLLKAFTSDLPDDEEARRVILEARTSALIQTRINRQAEDGTLPAEVSPRFLLELHGEFFAESQAELLIQYDDGHKRKTQPGRFRGEGVEVKVGEHIGPQGSCVARLVDELCSYYEEHSQGAARRVLDVAAQHHRLLFLHPFGDGNGRTIRLATHARLHMAGIGGAGLWSISRGFAQGRIGSVEGKEEYARMLARADAPRQGKKGDGTGALSRAALVEFTEWFLEVCLDQIESMTDVYALSALSERLFALADSKLKGKNKEHVVPLIHALLVLGELPRARALDVMGQSERSGRAILKELLDQRVLFSESERGPVRLELFHAALFPELLR